MAKFTSEHCRTLKPKAALKTTGKVSGNRYMTAELVDAMQEARNTIGSVRNSRTGRISDVWQKALKLGVVSVESKHRPLYPDVCVAALISRRMITDVRDPFIPIDNSRVKTPETIAEMLKTYGLRDVTPCGLDIMDLKEYLPSQ